MLSDLLRWGGKRPGQPDPPGETPAGSGGEPVVASKAFPKFLAALAHQPAPPVLVDFGPVIGANVSFFGDQLGCKLFIEDLFADYDRHARADTLDAIAGTFPTRFRHTDASVDGIFCWDIFDFLPKAAAPALAREVLRMLRPGGAVMGFFCTSAVPRAPFLRYEIVDDKSLRHRPHAGVGGSRHALQNRDIIKMFEGLILSDSFLLKNNTREILLKRRSYVMRPVIALLSDFGARDHYAGTMKGVILGICPDVTLVDITHDITPHDVLEGSLQLAASFKYFPAGTIFLAVVDPGVGSTRRGIAAEAGDYRFVGPDNGVLTAALRETPPKRVVELTERRYARPTVSRTFEGRDRFAPAAAWLAKGIQLSALGRAVTNYHMLDIPQADMSDARLHGVVLLADRFGNLVTNIDRRTFEAFTRAQAVSLHVAGHPIAGVVATYADIRNGEVCALFGSTDHLEFAVNGGSAAKALAVDRGAPVEITRA